MRFYEHLNMGEGISGPGDVGAGTSVLYSCSGIAFANLTTQTAGLYHYPASTSNNSQVETTIQQMINNIQPNEIVITPPDPPRISGLHMPGFDLVQNDIEAVRQMLQRLSPNARIVIASPSAAAQFLWRHGKPVYNSPPSMRDSMSLDEEDGIQAPENLRERMSLVPQPLGGGVMYYGGNGERRGALDQQPARLSRRRRFARSIRERCRFM